MKDKIYGRGEYSVAFAEKRLVGNEWNDVVWDKNHHQIEHHRLYYLTRGKARIHLYNTTLDLLPGNIYFIPAFTVLESEIDGEMDKYYVHFLSSSPQLNLYSYRSDRYSIPADDMTEKLFKCIVDNYTIDTEEAYLKVQGAMDLIIAPFFSGDNITKHSLVKFERVLSYIDENYKTNIRLSDLAGIMNISTMYFSNYFKEVFRISPKQYILNKRLSESQRLLLTTDMSVKEIAYALGFKEESYFSEFFTQKMGISALKFRSRNLPKTRSTVL